MAETPCGSVHESLVRGERTRRHHLNVSLNLNVSLRVLRGECGRGQM